MSGGVELATAYVSVVPTTVGIQSALTRQLNGPATAAGAVAGQGMGKGLSSGVLPMVKSAAGAMGGILAAVGIAAFAKTSIDTFKNAALETAKLQRVAGGTAEEMSRFRFAAKASGVDVGQFTSGIRLFGRNLAGASKDGKKAQDMVSALGFNFRDAAGNILPMSELLPKVADRFASMPNGAEKTALAMQLFGRAGTDLLPVLNKGSAGLAELGAKSDLFGQTLSKDNVAAFAKSREASRDWSLALEGLQIQVGSQLLPVVTDLIKWFTASAIPAITGVASWFRRLTDGSASAADKIKGVAIAGVLLYPVLSKVTTAATGAGKAIVKVGSAAVTGGKHVTGFFTAKGGAWDGIRLHAMNAKDAIGKVGQAAANAGKAAGRGLLNLATTLGNGARAAGSFAASMGQAALSATRAGIAAAGAAIRTVAMKVAQVAVAAATGIWTAAQWLLNVALNANPIGLIVLAIAAVIGIIALLWTKCEWFRNGVMAIWGAIQTAVGAVVDWFKTSVLPGLTTVWNWIKTGVSILWQAFTAYWGFILSVVRTAIEWIMANVWPKISAAFEAIKTGVSILWQAITTYWNAILTVIKTVVGAVVAEVTAKFNAAKSIATTVWNAISGTISSAVATIKTVLDAIKSKIDAVVSWFGTMKTKIGETMGGIGDAVKSAFKGAFNAVSRFWNSTVGKLSWDVPDWVPGIGGKNISGPKLPELAAGATVKPQPGGTLAILAEAGRAETVVDTGLLNQRLAQMDFARSALERGQSASMPSTLVVVDSDGALIGRMKVEAHQALDGRADELIYRNTA